MPSPEKSIELHDILKADKGHLEAYFQEITEFILPRKTQVTTYEGTPGQRQDWRRYENKGMHSCQLLASSIHGALTSSSTQWFELEMDDPELNDDDEIREWLSQASQQLYRAFNDSNFGNRIQQTYLDLGGYGTSALGCWERYDARGQYEGLRFVAYPIREYVFTEGADDRAGTFMRLLRWPVSRIIREYHKGTPGFQSYGREINDILARGDVKEMETERDLLIAIYPRNYNRPGTPFPNKMPIAYDVIDRKTQHRIIKAGTQEMPVFVPRWEANADDHGWGRGPGMSALGAVKQRAKLRYYAQRAVAKDADPAIVVEHRGIFGHVRTGPGGIVYKRKNAADPYTLNSGARYDATQWMMEDLAQEIEDYFYVDQLRPFHQTPNMTATEAQLRYELMMRLLGPTYGRLTYELFDPLIFRAFNIELRNGRIPQPPESVMAAMQSEEGASIKVNYVGPLAKAQKMKDVQAIERAYNLANTIAAATGRREAFDRLDDDKAMKHGTDVLGTPPEITRSDDETEQTRKQRQEAEAAAEQRQAAIDRGEAGQKAGAALESISRASQGRAA